MKITHPLLASLFLSIGFSQAALAQVRLQLIDPPSTVQAAPDTLAKASRVAERGQLRTRAAQPNWDTLARLGAALRASPDAAVGIDVPVFADKTLALTVDELEEQGETTTFYGHMDGDPLSSAVIVQSKGTFALHVNSGDRAYQVTFRGDGHEAAEIDRGAFTDGPDESHVPRPVAPLATEVVPHAKADAVSAADDGSIIDFMVIYSPAARAAAGGTAAIENQIALAVASVNQSYSNSAVVQRLRLVHTEEVAYTEPSPANLGTTLDQINARAAPFQNVEALRTQYGADVVSMLVENGGAYCGLGWIMQTVASWFAPYAYNVTVRSCATSGSTLAHELGHNMGLEHDLYVSPEGASHKVAQRYAHGYYDTVKRFRTVMAYADGCTAAGVTCTRINQFSTPDFLYNGGVTGNAVTADAGRMLDETRAMVASFRASVGTPPPPAAPVISLAQAAITVSEAASTASVVVTRTGSTTSASTVAWTTTNVSAIAGQDYSAASGTLTFAAGETSKTLGIPIVNDTTVESAETFRVSIASPTGATLGAITLATVTITDNDTATPPPAAGSLQFTASSYTVAEDGRTVLLQVTRAGSSTAAASVKWTATNGSATQGSDYGSVGRVATGTLTWRAGDAAVKSISIGVLNDTGAESTETFTVVLSAPVGVALGSPSTATVSITDNDGASGATATQLRFAATRYSVRENAGSVSVTVNRVNLGGGFAQAASVSFSTVPGTALAGADFTAVTGTLNWAAGDSVAKTITIPILNDTVADGTKAFTVALSGVSAGTSVGTPTVSVQIIDDERVTR